LPHGSNHGTAESSTQLNGNSIRLGSCNMTDNSNSLSQTSQPVTSTSVTNDVTYDHDFWNGDHYTTFLSGYIGFLEKDTRVLTSSIMHIAHFIQKHFIGG